MKALRKRTILIILTLFLLPVLAFGVWYGRQIQQQKLDHALIAAMKHNNIAGAIALLNDGADANATDKPNTPITFQSLLADFWNRMKRKTPPADTSLPALLLPYQNATYLSFDTEGMKPPAPDTRLLDNPALPELVTALLDHGANPSATDADGQTLLHEACTFDNLEIVKVLMRKHVNVNVKDKQGSTPLMCATLTGNRILLENGADVNAQNEEGFTPLMYLTDVDTCQLLLDHQAELDRENRWHRTALTYAIMGNQIRKARLLLQNGAKVSLPDNEGKTPLDHARDSKDDNVRALIPLLEAALKKEQTQQESSAGTATK